VSPPDVDQENEPWELLRVEVEIDSQPSRVDEPNDAIRHGHARLVRYTEEGEPGAELAALDWMQVEYGYGMDYGVDGDEIADAESQDLYDLHTALFAEGNLRPPFDHLEGMGHDLLVIEQVEVKAPQRFDIYAAELIEHVLRRWSQGCFAAAYIEDRPMNPRLAEVLLARGFQWHKAPRFGLYVADLGTPRPELPGEAKSRTARQGSGDPMAH
jgi:hypothetical protein